METAAFTESASAEGPDLAAVEAKSGQRRGQF